MSTTDKNQAHLHWANANPNPCFCKPEIYLNLDRLQPTTETIAALFGIRNPDCLSLENHQGEMIPVEELANGDKGWPLQANQHYQVLSSENTKTIPIHQLFPLFPGSNEDEKSNSIHKLSLNFYGKIWEDPDVPSDFRDKFWSRTSSSTIQAFRQYNWLLEVFGGPSLCGDELDTLLLPKVMAKHTSSRMTLEHGVTWLKLMAKTIQEEFPDQPEVRGMLELYWLHFYAFFPYSDDARRAMKKVVCEHSR
jgi:truncated hemoglobin YjbI